MINMQLINLQKRAKLNNTGLLELASHAIEDVNLKTIQKWRSSGNAPKIIIDNLNSYIKLLESYNVK